MYSIERRLREQRGMMWEHQQHERGHLSNGEVRGGCVTLIQLAAMFCQVYQEEAALEQQYQLDNLLINLQVLYSYDSRKFES